MPPSIFNFLLPLTLLGHAHLMGIADVSFQRIEQTTGFDILNSSLRITKFNRTSAVLNGTIDILVDLDNDFTFQIKSAYSRLGNNQFNEYPYKIAEQAMCWALNDTFSEHQELFEGTTNFPQVGRDGLCPFPAGHYWFKHFIFKPETMPQMIPEGYWRLTFLIVEKGGRTASLLMYMRISKESYW
ncbi:AAEL007754-PA [Aedes aegypti]|uniref:AAEL007754-PA n=1 Tax=Aedes aegypti TaxID=7159 RepID=Q170Z0_AEDAE|nr:AAEL007754-PA [Aedes aegypti]